MRIKNFNDRATLEQKPPTAAITVWKGEKKSNNRAGVSCGDRFRIEAPDRLKQTIKTACGATEKNGSLYASSLNVIPAYEDEMKTFTCQMALYSASAPVLFCDRETIHTRFQQKKDPYGGIYFQPTPVKEACPVAGTNFECPNKCSRTGDFYFYIYELVLAGYAEFCRLQVHGVADNQNIASVLDRMKADVGAIKNSPFVSEQTRSYVIYEMSRVKSEYKYPIKQNGVRTAKRGTKEDWIVNLTPHPIWLNKYEHHLSCKQLKAADIQPSVKLIEQIHDRELVASTHAINTPPLPPSDPFSMTPERFEELSALWKTHGWYKSAIAELLYSHFQISDREALMQLDEKQFEELKRLSADETIKQQLIADDF